MVIFLIDDCARFPDAFSDAWQRAGHIVRGSMPAETDQLALTDSLLPDILVITDSHVDGGRASMLSAVRQDAALRELPCVLLTGSGDPADERDALEAGADLVARLTDKADLVLARMTALHRRMTDARQQIAALTDQADRDLDALTYAISHDLRAPLRAIDGFSRILLEDFGASLDATAQDYLHRVCQAASRLGALFEDLQQRARVARANLHPADRSPLARPATDRLAWRSNGQPALSHDRVQSAGGGVTETGLMRSGVVLLVEDNRNDVELTRRAFEKSRLANRLVVMSDGAEALDYLFCTGNHAGREPEPPAVVLLDLKLPKITGLDVLRRMRADERTRGIPVVVLTSSPEECDLPGSCDRLANSFVRKPVDFGGFVEAARQLGLYWLVLNEPPAGPPEGGQ